MSLRAIADGYLVGYNGYDSNIYVFGKGPSATTVSATPAITTKGSSILITGTVTDQSAGQPGTPAIADKDMGRWMEHLHMQKPIPGDAAGVPVTLTATGSDGKTVTIAQIYSDISGTFGYKWTPPTEGTFKINAIFAGTDSYGSSYAETYAGVDPAPAAQAVSIPSASPTTSPTNSPTTSPSTAPGTLWTPFSFVLIAVAAAIIIVIIAVAAVVLRRRK